MADGGVMPQALPHRREVAVFFKLLLNLLAAVARKVHIENLPDRFRLRLIDDVFRPHLVIAKHVPGAVDPLSGRRPSAPPSPAWRSFSIRSARGSP